MEWTDNNTVLCKLRIIYHQERQQKCLELPYKHFVAGLTRGESLLMSLPEAQGAMLEKAFSEYWVEQKKKLEGNGGLFTLESLPENKWMTLKDKRLFSNPNALITSLCQTLAQDLIGKERACKEFWTHACTEKSKKLWLPTEIDWQDSPTNLLNLSSRNRVAKSGFSIKEGIQAQKVSSQKTSLLSPQSTRAETWVDAGTRTLSVRLSRISRKIRTKLAQIDDANRWTFNKALEYLYEKDPFLGELQARDMFVTGNVGSKPKPEGYVCKGRTAKKAEKSKIDALDRNEKQIRMKLERDAEIERLQDKYEDNGLSPKD